MYPLLFEFININNCFYYRPRLGPTMQKVVGLGSLYFILAIIDGVFRILGVNINLKIAVPKILIDQNPKPDQIFEHV